MAVTEEKLNVALRGSLRLYDDGTSEGIAAMALQAVKYRVDDSTEATFLIDTEIASLINTADRGGSSRYQDSSRSHKAVETIEDAVGPAVRAAKVVLDKITDIKPGTVELKFGIVATGGANWGIANAKAEAHFEVILTWTPDTEQAESQPATGS